MDAEKTNPESITGPIPTEQPTAVPESAPEEPAVSAPESGPESVVAGAVTTNPQPTTESAPKQKSNDKANTIKAILLAVVSSAVVVTVVVLLIIQLSNVIGPFGNKPTLYEHQAYFVPESTKTNTKYALVDKNGKALTEFNIEKFDSFVDGYTIVKTSEGWGIINDSGKMTVKPNEYDGLSRVGGLYTALKPGSSERKLIRGSGHVVTSYSSTLNTELGDGDYRSRNAAAVVIKREDNKYDIYNAHGKHLETVESEEAPVVSSSDATGDIEDTVTAISYKDGLIVIANNDLKEIYHTKDVDTVYRLYDVSRDASQMVFVEQKDDSSEAISYNTRNYDTKFAIFTGGKLLDIGISCSSASITDSETVPSGYIRCYSKNGSGFLDSKGILHLDTDTDRYIRNIPIDSDHYASFKYMSKTVSINGKNISAVSSVAASGNGYLVQTGTQRIVVDPNGKTVCYLPTNVSTFSGFDNNGVGIVRTSQAIKKEIPLGSSTSYYYSYSYSSHLIDKSCKTISEEYNSISKLGNYYVATKYANGTSGSYSNYVSGLIDKTGKEVIKSGEYRTISSASYIGKAKDFIVARKTDGKGILYDANLKQIVEFEGSVVYSSAQDYLQVTGEKYITFYTLEGTEIHSVPIGDGAKSQT